ncbi:MAG: hypothetical protein JSW20_05315 [Nitrospiraceae bacterium]|nr:MAG: hypothetical protein JSW20_05315 [Nitrospiraceae bacterium]
MRKYAVYCLAGIIVLMMTTAAHSVLTGQCSSCHTMHNRQNNSEMVNLTYGTETTEAKDYLLRGTCLGCHAQNTANRIEALGGNDVPQVYHKDPGGDLAGGNFAYIDGSWGSGASDKKGHNIKDFGSFDNPSQPPGRRHDIAGINTTVNNTGFTCAGTHGCHGVRGNQGNGLSAIEGAHHNNVDGQLSTADTVANSYRFLYYVIGLENTTGGSKWQNVNASNHNEYFGADEPMDFVSTGCVTCHDAGNNNNRPNNKTMSGFCATCHGYFHLLDSGGYALDPDGDGVGDDKFSPFKRHPTDVVLPNRGEYTSVVSYDVDTPVARTSPPASIDAGVSLDSDAVMCLSCHGAHATDFYKMLRWDIKGSLATAISGCGNCHTSKN